MITGTVSTEIFEALSLRGVYNKYQEWLLQCQADFKPTQYLAIIDIKSEREIPNSPNKGEGFAAMVERMMERIQSSTDDYPRPSDVLFEEQEQQKKQMEEFFETEPTQYYILVTYKIFTV